MPAFSGPLNGVIPFKYITGQAILPTGFQLTGSTITTAANDRFYMPFHCPQTQTFTGMKTFNQGVGDNTKTLRLGVYNDDAAAGGPGTLVIDAGEITLSGASALRTLASSFTLTAGKWYWMCSSHNAAAAIFGMNSAPQITAVGTYQTPQMSAFLGYKLTTAPSGTVQRNMPTALYVSTAYGALPATATAATSELSGNYAAATGQGVGDLPLCGIYV